tara:strand:- start:83 stop:232 length:150 start_codon:yes stop_codon:yes gene_type:complete
MNNETKQQLSDAIDYFHKQEMKEELCGDSKFYLEAMLEAVAIQLGITLV